VIQIRGWEWKNIHQVTYKAYSKNLWLAMAGSKKRNFPGMIKEKHILN